MSKNNFFYILFAISMIIMAVSVFGGIYLESNKKRPHPRLGGIIKVIGGLMFIPMTIFGYVGFSHDEIHKQNNAKIELKQNQKQIKPLNQQIIDDKTNIIYDATQIQHRPTDPQLKTWIKDQIKRQDRLKQNLPKQKKLQQKIHKLTNIANEKL